MKSVQVCFVGLSGSGKTELVKKLQQKEEIEAENFKIYSFKQGDSLIYLADTPYNPDEIKMLLALLAESDACVFCIDSTQPISPKHGELILLLNYIGHDKGVVVFTKSDSTTPDVIEKLKTQMKAILSESTLKSVEFITTSTVTEEGIVELREALVNLTPKDRDESGAFKMPIEIPVEVKSGFTNVYGIIERGSVKKYDKTIMMPWGKEFIVQEIKLHGEVVESAKAGDRVSILYKGLNKWDVQTGDVVAAENSLEKAKKIKCEIEISKFFKDELRSDSDVQLNIGLQTLPVHVNSISKDGNEVDSAKPGDKVVVEFESKIPFAFEKNQKAIVYNPEAHWKSIKVVGAGSVLEGLA